METARNLSEFDSDQEEQLANHIMEADNLDAPYTDVIDNKEATDFMSD